MLFSAEILLRFLNQEFSGYVLSDAFNRVEKGAYYKLVNLGSNFFQTTINSGSLKRRSVTLRAVKKDQNLVPEVECDCSFKKCKHQAILLYLLIKEDKAVDEDPPVIESYDLKSQNPAVFRPFNFDSQELIDILELNPELLDFDDNYDIKYHGFFNNPEMLTIKSKISKEYSWRNKYTDYTIVLKKTKNGLEIKCENCTEKTNMLCSHQYAVVDEAYERIGFLFDEGEWEEFYNNAIAGIVERMKIPSHLVGKYFRINLSERGWSFEQHSSRLLGGKWIKKINDKILEQKRNRAKRKVSLTEKLESGGSQIISTYYWSKKMHWYNDRKITGLCFCSGKALKSKEGLQKNGRKISDNPGSLPPSQTELALNLFSSTKLKDDQQRFEHTQRLILENLDLLNQEYHYVNTNFPMTRKVKDSYAKIARFHPSPLKITLEANTKDGVVEIKWIGEVNEQKLHLEKIHFVNEFFCADEEFIYLFENKQYSLLFELFENSEDESIEMLVENESIKELLANLRNICEVKINHPELKIQERIIKEVNFQILLREVGNFITFEPRLSFEDQTFNIFDPELNYFSGRTYYNIDSEKRDVLLHFIQQAHPSFNVKNQVQDYVFLPIKEMMNNYWFLHFVEACVANEIEILGQKELSKFNYSKHRAKTYSHIESGIDWFEVDMGVSFGNEKIKTADWIKALRNNESFIILKDGSMGMLPEEWLTQARKVMAVADLEKGTLKISKYRFNIIEDLFGKLDDKKIIKELAEKKKRLANYDTNKKYKLPKKVKAEFRPYQKHGYAWLKFLEESGFGGILADDMGLGKTLQVISLLADQKNKKSSMVIVPRSLLFNWAAEIEKFCPKLTYTIHHGPNRGKELGEMIKRDLIISTYDTTAADIEIFREFRFNYIILDESQAIKNPDSKRYKAMRLLQSENKIAMTGTPIENNTFDLYAQLSFTSPGLLGSKTSFRNNFSIPIDNEGNQDAANLLRKLIHPFILRRTKEQVASDLPEKTETILYCEMATPQRKLYDKLRLQVKQDIEEVVEEEGFAKSKFKILDGLLRLRQMCNSPLLVNSAFTGNNAESVKINLLIKNLTEGFDQHNALIFSQFTSLLAIVRNELDKRNIPYAYLDGSTRKRQEVVEKFMNDSEVKIFLISIKAGNTGLNLTKADYVYILDPWWNPAVEAQAIDRTHRIGQDKQVFAYKLICKDSIEEKILKLQQKKKKLAQDLIRTDENVLKSLKKEELMSLFD